DKPCRLRTLDLDGDGRAEVLLATSGAILTFAQDAEDQWVQSAQYTAVCTRRPADDLTKPFAEAMTVAPSSLPDLVIGGQRLQAQPQISCPPPTPR
ncbi:MAG: VCBS repeat-containing protein, partial [Phenylobacterium sp.]|nr:VCBS repeat-containing protein [Phenylobacterium sp.]